MTLTDRIRQLVAGKPAAPAPKIAVSSGGPADRWKKQDRDAKTLQGYRNIYERGGPVAAAVDCYPDGIATNGYRFTGGDAEIKQVSDRLASFDFPTAVSNLITDAVVLGDGFGEVVRTRSGEFHSVQERDGARFRIQIDPSTGQVLRYLYLPEDTWDESKATPLDPRDVVHIRLWPKPGSPYGRSLIARAIDDINRDTDTVSGIAEGTKRHGTPKWDITVGDDDPAAPDPTKAEIDDVAREYKDINGKTEFVHSKGIAIEVLDTAGIPGADMLLSASFARLCSAMGTPAELIGGEYKGSTEATAKVRMAQWWNRIRALQPRVARQISMQVVDQITGRPGAVGFVWEDPDPADETDVAEWATKLMQATPLDPFAVLPRKYVQERLGIDPTQYEGDEEYGTGAE